MTDWKRKNKENHEIQIFISRRMRAERTQSNDVKDVHKDIYQSEIIDKQWLEEKTEMLNKWKSSVQHDHHIRKHYIESSSQEVKNKWVKININHINFSIDWSSSRVSSWHFELELISSRVAHIFNSIRVELLIFSTWRDSTRLEIESIQLDSSRTQTWCQER